MPAFNYILSVTGDCSNTSSGALSVFLEGGTPPYTVEFISPFSSVYIDVVNDPVVVTGLYADTYYLRVNDSTLPENLEYYINIPVSNGVCATILNVNDSTCGFNNGSVTGTSTSLYSSTSYYIYNNDNTFITSAITNASSIVFQNLSADTYYMVANDLGGCTGRTSNFIVEESIPFDFGLYVVPNSSCNGVPFGKVIVTGLTGVAPYTYIWSNGQTGSTISGLTAGTYTVQVTDGSGCKKTKAGVVVDSDPMGLALFEAIPPSCLENNGELTLNITGGTGPYYYSANTGNVKITYMQSFTLTGISAGYYEFLVTDATLCTLQVATTLSSEGGINSVTTTVTNSNCGSDNGSVLITVDGGQSPYVYTLIYPDSTNLSVTNDLTSYEFTNLYSGTYTVFVQDATGCSYQEEISVIAESKFDILTQVTGTSCNLPNGVISIQCSSGFTLPLDYSLDGVQNIIDTTLSAVTFVDVTSGQHTVTVTDADGCQRSKQIVVLGSVGLNYTLYTTSCGSGNNGSITTFISSGTPPFTFDWSDNVMGNPQNITVNGLSGGTYSVSIIDDNGCSLTRSTTIECDSSSTSYQTYVMGSEEFSIESPTKCGLIQMLNEGYLDLIEGNYNCNLVSATFIGQVSVTPMGLFGSQSFYTTNSLSDAPTDEEWYTTITELLLSIPGVNTVTVDGSNNVITIQSYPNDATLSGQEIKIEIKINYNINC